MSKKLVLILCALMVLSASLFGCSASEQTGGAVSATPDTSPLLDPDPKATPEVETIIIPMPQETVVPQAPEATKSPDSFFNVYLDGSYIAERGFITYIEGAIMLPAQAIADALDIPFLVDDSTGITYIGHSAEITVTSVEDELTVGFNNEKQVDGSAILREGVLYLNASVALEAFELTLDINEVGDVFLNKLPDPTAAPTPKPTEDPENSGEDD